MPNRLVGFMSTRSRREQLIIAALAVFLIIVASVLFLSGGADEAATNGDVGPRLTRPPTPAPEPRPTLPPITAGGFDGRDPFEPLVVEAVDGGSPDDGAGDAPSTGGPSGPNPSGEQRRVTLVDIFAEDGDRMATVQVGEEQFTVGEGETFDDNFQVIDITERCATFLYGDERFTLCIGQEVRK